MTSNGAAPTPSSQQSISPSLVTPAPACHKPQRAVTRASNCPEAHVKAKAIRAGFKRPSFWVLFFGWFLAICAGFVNAVAFRTWNLYVSHVTGSSTAIGLRIEGVRTGEEKLDGLEEALWLVFAFFVGAFACGLLIDKNTVHFLGKAFYGLALVGNSALLVCAALLQQRLASACFAAAACGLQNAMCTSHFGAVVRTTHVTGTVTDMGSTLGRMAMIYLRKGCRRSRLNVMEKAEVGVDARKLLVLLPMWCCFVIGCVAGAEVENFLRQYSFLVPAAFTLLVGTGYMFFRQTLKDYIKGLEREKLSADFETVQVALAHAQSRLHTLQLNMSAPPIKASSVHEDVVCELDEEMGHMMEALQEVEADIDNLSRECDLRGVDDEAA